MNRFSNVSTSKFDPLSLEEIMTVPLAKQQQHNALQASADEYSALQSQRLGQDSEAVDAKLNELKGRSDEISNTLLESGVNKNLSSQFRKLKRDKEKEFSQSGLVGAAAGNYTSATSFVNDLATKKEQQAGWSPARAKAWAQGQVKDFKGTLNEDGTFASFAGAGLATKVERNDWINDNLKLVASDVSPASLKFAGNLDQFNKAFRSGKIDELEFNKIMGSLTSRAANDPDLLASLKQEGFFTGEDNPTNIGKWSIKKGPDGKNREEFEPGSSFGRQIYAAAQGAKFKNVTDDYKFLEDKAAWELHKKGLVTHEANELVRAAHGEANTITSGNIDRVRDNIGLALNEMTRQEGLLADYPGDKEGREYEELKSNHDNSKIQYFNLKSKIDNIERVATSNMSDNEKKAGVIKEEIDVLLSEHGTIAKVLEAEGIEAEEIDTGFSSRPRDHRNLRRFYEARGLDVSDLGNTNDFNSFVSGASGKRSKLIDKYLEESPYSESYVEFGGIDSGKGTSEIGLINKNLTENFDGANYSVAYTGESLNTILADTYSGKKITKEIRTTNGYDEMGHPIEHLIIRDESGNVIESKSVTRGALGLVENRRVANSLMSNSDPDLAKEGYQMMANITYMPIIKSSGIRNGGDAGIFSGKKAVINGVSEEITWEKRVNYNGSDVWVVKIGDKVTSPDLYGENEIASYFANLGKK